MVELRTLGSLGLRRSDGEAIAAILTQPKRVALLAYLTLAGRAGPIRRDTLLALFWPEQDAEHARGALRQALSVLRRAVGEDAFVTRGTEEVAVDPTHVWCDAVAFEHALDAGKPEEALEVYRGDLLPGFFVSDAPDFERWLDAERRRLRNMAASAAWTLAEQQSKKARPAEARALAQRAVQLASDDEGLLRRAIALLDDLGDRATAITVYEAFAERLRKEFELEPAPETRTLLATVRVRQTANGRTDVRALPWDVSVPVGNGEPSLVIRPVSRRLAPVAMVLVAAAISDFTPVTVRYGGSQLGDPIAWVGRPSDWLARPRIAVLSVQNTDGDSAGARFANALTEDIAVRLSNVRGLVVLARETVRPLEAGGKTPREIARALQASAVFKGSARRGGNRVRIVAQLIDAGSEAYLWGGSFDRELQDVFAVQAEIADSVASALRVTLTEDERRLVRRRGPRDWTTNELSEEARRVWNSACGNALTASCERVPDAAEVRRRREYAMSLVERALELDPRFGAALAMRASWRYHMARVFGGPPVPLDSTEAALRFAIATDSTDPRSWRALALFYGMFTHKTRSAAEAGLRVVQLDPYYLFPFPMTFLEGHWAATGRFFDAARLKVRVHNLWSQDTGEAIARISLLLGDYPTARGWYEHLIRSDPADAVSRAELAEIRFLEGKASEALAATKEALELARGNSEVLIRHLAATLQLMMNEYDAAAALLEPIANRHGFPRYFDVRSTTNLAFANMKLARHREADSLFAISRELDHREMAEGAETFGQPLDLARIAAVQGDRAEAYRWLQVAIDAGWRLCYRVGQGMNDPLFERLREDRRFRNLMAEVKADVDAQRRALEQSEDRLPAPPTGR